MSDIVISVENLSKSYLLGHNTPQSERYTALRDVITRNARNLARKTRDMLSGRAIVQGDEVEEFWALKDITFQLNRGEMVGIIGRNGAGKSTLLKILSRITEPTTGRIKIAGRIASLLEVGTGFHPELTGRENVFLNGAILGMTRAEIQRKFDEIVAFAEVEKFLDTPVKRYSSGMYVRLAFAVAAHLDPDILIIDEVLAVGDLAFQKKCLGKMNSTAQEGRTVLLVSHNMQFIRNLCTRSILLSGGNLVCDSDTESTLNCYHEMLGKLKVTSKTSVTDERNRRGSGAVRFTDIAVLDADDNESNSFNMGDTIRFRLGYCVLVDVPELLVSIVLRGGASSESITSVRYVVSTKSLKLCSSGEVFIDFPEVYIRPGQYPLYFWLGDSLGQPFDVVDDLTLPLSIGLGDDVKDSDIWPMSPTGFFSIPSRISLGKMEQGGIVVEPTQSNA
jgi:lipopolysaccharide transport system ATP-binding protein